jgi:hypothetical protein
LKIIEITVLPDGSSKVETKGFSGSECRDASRFLETALGQATSERLTSDFYQDVASESQQAQQRQG